MTANTKTIPTQSHDTSEKSKQLDSTVGSYLICEKIGQGSFATVYKAQHKVNEKKNILFISFFHRKKNND